MTYWCGLRPVVALHNREHAVLVVVRGTQVSAILLVEAHLVHAGLEFHGPMEPAEIEVRLVKIKQGLNQERPLSASHAGRSSGRSISGSASSAVQR